MGQILYAKERFADVIDEAMPLLLEHWREIAAYQDIPLAIDRDEYQRIEDNGNLVIFTARLDGTLIGYSAFTVSINSHYSTSGLWAKGDVVYLDPVYRGSRIGLTFIKYCDDQLAELGIKAVIQHEKIAHPALGRVLQHLGYDNIERIWARRLGGKD